MKNITKLNKIISRFKDAKILVIGDLILDEFIWGKVDRISPEAPVPVVWVNSESFMPGGAANVANNIHALGGKVYLAGIIGEDRNGQVLKEELEKKGIDIEGIIVDRDRPTTLKTRIIAHHQQVVRVDREKLESIDDNVLEQILTFAREMIDRIDALIIEDYGKGIINSRLLAKIIPLAKRHKKIITVDPKVNHFAYYRQVTAVTPNQAEAEAASGIKIQNDKDIDRVGKKLLKELDSDSVLITLGENGMRLFKKKGRIIHIPTVAQEVFDVSGAGDTTIATFTLSLAAGATLVEAAHLANFTAGIVVGKIGVAVATQEELKETIRFFRKMNEIGERT